MFKNKFKLMGQRGFSAVGLAFVGMLTAIFAALGLYIANEVLVAAGYSTTSGLWSLLPILFPFIAIAAIILGIYGLYKMFGE